MHSHMPWFSKDASAQLASTGLNKSLDPWLTGDSPKYQETGNGRCRWKPWKPSNDFSLDPAATSNAPS